MTIANQAQKLLKQAQQQGFNDLYFKPQSEGWLIYGRTPRVRQRLAQLDLTTGQALINFFKFNSQMDLSEHRRPQIGAWRFQQDGLDLNLRLTTVGDYQNRECLVIRLLYLVPTTCEFLNQARFDRLSQLLSLRGLILFSGPTGSGKTTLMYYLAQKLAREQSVLTIEDPTEIEANTFTQLQVNERAGMTYQELLKISLRLRPDVLIIGEIRDPLTAAIAIQAALSGHLVLATVHARSCGGVIERLRDLQISTVVLQNALTACCYQRLLTLTNQRTVVALDLLDGQNLWQQLDQPQKTMCYWQTDLQRARHHGQISETTWLQYQYG